VLRSDRSSSFSWDPHTLGTQKSHKRQQTEGLLVSDSQSAQALTRDGSLGL
jgi:hypothetical protein